MTKEQKDDLNLLSKSELFTKVYNMMNDMNIRYHAVDFLSWTKDELIKLIKNLYFIEICLMSL